MIRDPNNPCLFCNAKESGIAVENKFAYASYDSYPVSDFHCLIIPKRHVKDYFEILFLEETWIEILDGKKSLLKNGLFKIGESLMFEFKKEDSDFFIKSGNLGGFQIFYNEEFFAPFGLSGQVSKGFFFKEKINTVKNVRILKNEY